MKHKLLTNHKGFLCILLALLGNVSWCDAQVWLVGVEKYDCLPGFEVGYNFNYSYANRGAAGIRTLKKNLKASTLEMTIGFYANCGFGDTTGIQVNGDTIELLYGPRFVKTDGFNGTRSDETEIALCNCCLNFTYVLSVLDPSVNYVFKARNMAIEADRGQIFDVLTNAGRSIHYSRNSNLMDDFDLFFEKSIAEYRKLLALYTSLSTELPSDEWNSITVMINQTWFRFFNAEKAVRDPYIATNLTQDYYSDHIHQFNSITDSLSIELMEQYNRLDSLGVQGDFFQPLGLIVPVD